MQLQQWVPPDRLADWMIDATDSLLAPVDDFSPHDERWTCDYLEIVNPAIWEIAHVAWFAEWFVLRQLHGREPLMENVDAFYDSAKVPHITRWQLDYPDSARTLQYVRDVGESLAELAANDGGADSTTYFTLYSIMHHDAHTEALTYTRQTLGWAPHPELAVKQSGHGAVDTAAAPVEVAADLAVDLTVDGGRLLLGGSRSQPFIMDNERWAHPVDVAPFKMAKTPVTMEQFAEFVDDGGYENKLLWSPDGWAWRESADASKPVYWRGRGAGAEHRVFDTWSPITESASLPMTYVSWWEVEAYCEWAGRRLPTEAEWEMAATTGPDGAKQSWFPWGDRDAIATDAALDAHTGGLVPVGAFADSDGPWGHRQLIGNVWEWTSSVFGPFPHFEPDAYRDNSEPWFGSRRVLRGGSWATRSRYVRSTFRNYFTPDRRDVIAGFRTCAVD